MDRDSMKKLEVDVRMLGRRNWITQEDLAKRLAELPDVADKAVQVDDDPSATDN